MSDTLGRERKKKYGRPDTSKNKCCLGWEFVKVAYANFFEVIVLAKHENTTCGGKWHRLSEDIIIVGGESDCTSQA